MKRAESCYTCRYWEGHGLRQRGPKGTCRRLPPVVTPRNQEGLFPITKLTDWCGEWQRESGRAALPEGADSDERAAGRTIYDDLGP